MHIIIADTFTAALARLPAQDQKAVKISTMDLQLDPTGSGLQMHRIDKSKDANFWSARVNRDIRLILHKSGGSTLVAYVDHHDRAYAWAERRRIDVHPRTGAVQIVEVQEMVEAELTHRNEPDSVGSEPAPARRIFERLTPDDLLSVGVPEDWLEAVLAANEDDFFDMATHLPAEAGEGLLEYATTGILRPAEMVTFAQASEAFDHPDAQRRFRVIASSDELQAALDAPWDAWSVFLHPSQRAAVERAYSGPARVTGSAGTGKTVVALHRAVRALRGHPDPRVLLTTFSDPLAENLAAKIAILAGPNTSIIPRIRVTSFQGLANELFQLVFGRKPRIATLGQIEEALDGARVGIDPDAASTRFLRAEWMNVIDAWQVADADAYSVVPRVGRKARLGSKQRERLWPIFEDARRRLAGSGLTTWAQVFGSLTDHYWPRSDKPFTHIVVDEAQDLGVPELRLLRAIAPDHGDALFFAGDLGQRIFQQPFSWKGLGVDVRGRATTLTVNYRTSQQIRKAADGLLPGEVRDADGESMDRRTTISLFEGPAPIVALAQTEAAEISAVAEYVSQSVQEGVAPAQIGVFVRSTEQLQRARSAVEQAGLVPQELSAHRVAVSDRVAIGTMHLAKGLEFKAVAVMACDDGVLPLQRRIDTVVDEVELDEVYTTERHLLYVACTRARDRLLVSGVCPGSEFLTDLKARTS